LLKKTITYTNPFTDQEVSEEHYFHISKADLVEMEMEEHAATYDKDGTQLTGMQAKLQRIIDSQDGKAIMSEFKDIIRRSYGVKEGDSFRKSQTIAANFMGSEAFSQLLWELCTNAGAAAEFMNGVVPNNLDKIAGEIQAKAAAMKAEDPTGLTKETPHIQEVPKTEKTLAERIAEATAENPAVLSQQDLVDIDSDELKSGIATGRIKLS
jgi:hypothetical protein